MPHNIMLPGPSHTTRTYLDIWRNFVPESQKHIFEHGAYFWVEVVPSKLAVFSLNTMYFFGSNTAVDGCSDPGEPGFQQFTWLKVQLDLMRQRGMKAILMGHVPPARTKNKQSWDDSCWAKYTIWLWNYRDVVVGNIYGHMNLDHFMLLDIRKAQKILANPGVKSKGLSAWDDNMHIEGATSYLSELRELFSKIPEAPEKPKEKKPSPPLSPEKNKKKKKGDKKKKKKKGDKKKKKKPKNPKKEHRKYLGKIGGKYAERYVPVLVSPSVVPNYFPSLRIIDYNITGLVDHDGYLIEVSPPVTDEREAAPKPPRDPNHPEPPPTGSAPGPAYSPQPLSITGITQYYANLTKLNGWVPNQDGSDDEDAAELPSDEDPKKPKKPKKPRQPPLPLEYEVEYRTANDTKGYKMKDLSVRSFVNLADKMRDLDVKSISLDDDDLCSSDEDSDSDEYSGDQGLDETAKGGNGNKKKKKKKGRKHKNHHKKQQKKRDKVWHVFVKRAFVGAADEDEIRKVYL
ncbi:Endopolyphosphatase [Arthrobotrys entomopaga]|nr:Endopolyphosphatase [Arthrobotrys entomopaga]